MKQVAKSKYVKTVITTINTWGIGVIEIQCFWIRGIESMQKAMDERKEKVETVWSIS